MENQNQSGRRETRRHQIGDRLAAIRTRITDLEQARESALTTASGEQLAEAQHHAASSRATAQQALASSIEGLLRAAQAHERCAISHERLATAPHSNEELHRQQAAHHRAAAAADRQRAERARSLLTNRAENRQEDEQQEGGTACLARRRGFSQQFFVTRAFAGITGVPTIRPGMTVARTPVSVPSAMTQPIVTSLHLTVRADQHRAEEINTSVHDGTLVHERVALSPPLR